MSPYRHTVHTLPWRVFAPTFLPMERVLLGTTDKQKEQILPRGIASLGMVSRPLFIQLLGWGSWRWDPLLSGQKAVEGVLC